MRLRGFASNYQKAALIGLGSWIAVPAIAFLLLGQATAQKPQNSGDLPADAPKPPPSLLTGQPNAEQPQPPGTPPAAAKTPQVAPNETAPPAPAGGGPLAQPLPQAQQSTPNSEVVLALVRNTLLAFNDANITGDYTVLHSLAAPTFQHDVDAETLSASFKAFREQKIDVSPIAVLVPAFVKPPVVDQDGFLRIAGAFPSQPLQVRFSLAYQMIEGRWRYAGLAAEARPVQTAEAAPSAPEPAPQVVGNAAPAPPPLPTPAPKHERQVRARSGMPPATKRW